MLTPRTTPARRADWVTIVAALTVVATQRLDIGAIVAGGALTVAALAQAATRRHGWGIVLMLLATLELTAELDRRSHDATLGVDVDALLSQRLGEALGRLEHDLARTATLVRGTTATTTTAATLESAVVDLELWPGHGVTLWRDGSVQGWSGDVGFAAPPSRHAMDVVGAGAGARLRLARALDGGVVAIAEVAITALGDRRLPPPIVVGGGGELSGHSLRRPDGTVLARVRLPAPVRAVALLPVIAAVSLALTLAILGLDALRRDTMTSPLNALLLIGAARLALLSPAVRSLQAFAPTTLAVVSPLDLFSSAGDLFASALGAAAVAAIALRFRPARPSLAGGAALAAAAAIIAWTGSAGLLELVARAARNSALPLTDYRLIPLEPVRLAIASAFATLALAHQAVTTSLLRHARAGLETAMSTRSAACVLVLSWTTALMVVLSFWVVPRPPAPAAALALLPLAAVAIGRPTRWRAALHGLAAALAFLVAATSLQRTTLTSFLEDDLAATLRHHSVNVRWTLESTMEELAGPLGAELANRPLDEIAYRAWRDSRLAAERHRAAIEVTRDGQSSTRFWFRLPVPNDARPVMPGSITLQDVLFQGRQLRVLAGSARLPDGSQVTVRVGEDLRGLPFFPDVPHLSEVVRPGSIPRLDPVALAGVELSVFAIGGDLIHATSANPFPVDRARLTAATEHGPHWWSKSHDGLDWDAFTFPASDRILTLALPRPAWSEHMTSAVHLAILLGLIGGLLTFGRSALDWLGGGPPPTLSWLRRSYFRKAVAVIALATILPAVSVSLYLQRTIDTHVVAEMRQQATTALELARRILAEFAAAEPGAVIDDSVLIWVAQTVGYDLALFDGPVIAATSTRELVREGFLSSRPDPEAFRAVVLDGAPNHLRARRHPTLMALDATTRLADDRTLTLYAVAPDHAQKRAGAERSRVVFLATVALVVMAALLACVP